MKTSFSPRIAIILCLLSSLLLIPNYANRAAAKKPEQSKKITVCHVPPGNPDNPHTITIPPSALKAHLAHGDTPGACEEPSATPTRPPR